MPNPKRRHSKRRTSTRRAHDHLKAPAFAECPNCHEMSRHTTRALAAAFTKAVKLWTQLPEPISPLTIKPVNPEHR